MSFNDLHCKQLLWFLLSFNYIHIIETGHFNYLSLTFLYWREASKTDKKDTELRLYQFCNINDSFSYLSPKWLLFILSGKEIFQRPWKPCRTSLGPTQLASLSSAHAPHSFTFPFSHFLKHARLFSVGSPWCASHSLQQPCVITYFTLCILVTQVSFLERPSSVI